MSPPPTPKPPARVGVIGAGKWGRNLVRNFHALGALAAVAERDPAARDALAHEFPHAAFFDGHESLLASGLDAVAVATPVPLHHPVARDALRAGMDVLVEKPLTFSVAEAEELVALADAGGRVLMVGHLLLYQPAVAAVKEFLAGGGLGRVFTLHQQRAKLGRVRQAENALWSLGVHDVAVLLHLVGEEVASVQFSGHCGLQDGIADDTYLHLTFPGGAAAHLHNSWLWPENRRRLTIVGQRGMLVYDEVENTVTLHHKTVDADLAHHDAGSEILFSGGSGEPLRAELEHFLECLATRARPRSDGRDGLAVVRVLEEAAGQHLTPVTP